MQLLSLPVLLSLASTIVTALPTASSTAGESITWTMILDAGPIAAYPDGSPIPAMERLIQSNDLVSTSTHTSSGSLGGAARRETIPPSNWTRADGMGPNTQTATFPDSEINVYLKADDP